MGTVLERNHHCVRKRPGKNRANDYLTVTNIIVGLTLTFQFNIIFLDLWVKNEEIIFEITDIGLWEI